MNILKTAFELAYQKSPIMLCDGLAKKIPGGMLPLILFTDGLSIVNGLIGGDVSTDLISSNFKPAPGSTLVSQDVSSYPFLNQATAANAVVQRPNRVNMIMTSPATTRNGGYPGKPMMFYALKLALDEHNSSGGTYTVMTPSYIYTGCLLRNLIDISSFNEEIKQVQYEWAFEFEQPLLLPSELEVQMKGWMKSATNGTPNAGGTSFSGAVDAATGAIPS